MKHYKLNTQVKFNIDYLYIFILVIYAGRGTTFVRSIETWENKFALILPIAFAIYVAFIKDVKISERFMYLLVGYLGFNILLTMQFSAFHPRFIGIYLISFFLTYIAIKAYGIIFFTLYANIIYFLVVVSFIFWLFQQILPAQLNSIMNTFSFLEPGARNVQSTIVFYTINIPEAINNTKVNFGGISLSRNAGFAWEPGAFSVFINLAIFINLIKNQFRLRKNRELWIYIVVLITTFSTTGYSIFMLLIAFYVYNTNSNYKVLIVPIIVVLGLYILTLPFMMGKLIDVSQHDTNKQIRSSILYNKQFTLQRINSFIVDFQDFKNNPLLGYGGQKEERWTFKLGAQIATISGIGKVFAQFGLVGFIFFFFLLYKSSKLLAIIFNFKGWIFPFLMIIMISISYSLIFNALLMCFWLFSLFHPRVTTFRLSFN